jgi:hypothetical protein
LGIFDECLHGTLTKALRYQGVSPFGPLPDNEIRFLVEGILRVAGVVEIRAIPPPAFFIARNARMQNNTEPALPGPRP